ncbi:MAG: glycosyltransferase family 2 protein [Richelia sp. RM2_1_2]|nr:glycosyltransferase family 2 protein [Richelia sp. RM2_1_2]
MKIYLFTQIFNEEKILPFFFQHYESFVDHFYVYDNLSTDRSREICKARSDVTVITFPQKNLDEFILTANRNKMWQRTKSKPDFVIVCDADEFLYSKNIIKTLKNMKDGKYTVAKPTGFGMLTKKFPEEGKLITKQIKTGIRTPMMDKCVLFSPKQIEKMNFGLGSHHCLPEGRVKVYSGDLKLLHYKGLGVDYSLERKNLYKKRVPKRILKMGISKHYFADDKQFVKAIASSIKKAKKVI